MTRYPEIVAAIDQIQEHTRWKATRYTALARHERVEDQDLTAFVRSNRDVAELTEMLRRSEYIASLFAEPRWMPPRPERRMPSVQTIVKYWDGRHPFEADPLDPRCFGCSRAAPEWSGSYFERAHLVDRCLGGLDHVGNLALLCSNCHRVMPSFDIDEGPQAIGWVVAGGVLQVVAEIAETWFDSRPT